MKHARIYLTEGVVANSTKQARNIYIHYRKELDGENDIEKLKKEFLVFKNEIRTIVVYLRYEKEVNGQVIKGLKYIEGCTRIYFEEHRDLKILKKLDPIIGILVKDPKMYNTYKSDFNGLSFLELSNTFKEKLVDISANEHNEIEKMSYTNKSQNYDIIPINSFEEAEKYYPLCIHKSFSKSDNKPEWCLTYEENNFSHYSDNGLNQIYFCVRKGIKEDDEPIQGDGHPQDDYGNSMISVIVDEEGELAYSTSRWNHELEGSDKAYSVVDISRIVGVDFYKTFKPNRVFQDAVDKAMGIFHESGSFEGFEWVNKADYKGVIIKVCIQERYNLINRKTGELLSKKWFNDLITDKDLNLYIVGINKKGYNILDNKGNFMLDSWYENIVCGGEINKKNIIFKVRNNKKYNFLNLFNKKIISDIWFDGAHFFIKRNNVIFVEVKKDNKYNFLKLDGTFISDIWFDKIYSTTEDFIKVNKDDKFNIVDPNIGLISDIWFDQLLNFHNGFAIVFLNDKLGFNLMDTNGNIFSNIWFQNIDYFGSEYSLVVINHEQYILKYDGNLYNSKKELIKNVSIQENIKNETIYRANNIFINEVLDLNKRIKKLYE